MEFAGTTSDLEQTGFGFDVAGNGDAASATSGESGLGAGSGDSGNGNRGRGRPRKSDGNNGSSNQRSADRAASGQPASGNADKTESVETNSVRVEVSTKKPNDNGFKTKTPAVKTKKGYAPLLNKQQSIEAVDNIFGAVAVAVDSRWSLDESEAKELGERLGNLLALFPVKMEENPLLLQRIMAILALLMGLIVITKDRAAASMTEENDGFIRKIFKKDEQKSAAGKA